MIHIVSTLSNADTQRSVDRNDTLRIISLMSDAWIDRAKAQMAAHGISHQALANALGCTRGAVGHYLSGRREASLKQLSRIARALHVDLSWLLHGNGSGAVQEPAAAYSGRDLLIPIAGNTRSGPRPGGHLLVPTPARNCYGLTVTDDSYSPRVYAGEIVVVDPGPKPLAGDEVVVQYRSGRLRLHTFINEKYGQLTLDSISGRRERRRIKKKDIKFLHKIIAVFRAGEDPAPHPGKP